MKVCLAGLGNLVRPSTFHEIAVEKEEVCHIPPAGGGLRHIQELFNTLATHFIVSTINDGMCSDTLRNNQPTY